MISALLLRPDRTVDISANCMPILRSRRKKRTQQLVPSMDTGNKGMHENIGKCVYRKTGKQICHAQLVAMGRMTRASGDGFSSPSLVVKRWITAHIRKPICVCVSAITLNSCKQQFLPPCIRATNSLRYLLYFSWLQVRSPRNKQQLPRPTAVLCLRFCNCLS